MQIGNGQSTSPAYHQLSSRYVDLFTHHVAVTRNVAFLLVGQEAWYHIQILVRCLCACVCSDGYKAMSQVNNQPV